MKRSGAWLAVAGWIAGVVGLGGCAPTEQVEPDRGSSRPETVEAGPDPAVELLPVVPDDGEPGALGVHPGAPTWATPPPAPWTPKKCPKLFDEALQTFEVEIDPADWSAMQHEFQNAQALQAAGQAVEVYRPLLRFTHADKSTTQAMIRLRGNPTYWDRQQKMQFQISFNEQDPDGRFRGLRKIVLDSAHYNLSYLRDRLAMSIARDAGLPAPCVNHARLYVNGQFYGLYTHLEKVDREFLERNFEDPGANLYKSNKDGGELKTNEDESPDTSRLIAFWEADEVSDLESLMNLRQVVRAWAAEAVFPDADGYWAGGWNFYLYDEPGRGFSYILWDIDLGFDGVPANADPMGWHKTNLNFNGRPHVERLLADPKWRWEFVREVRHVRDAMDEDELEARIDTWAAQVRESAKDDVLAPWDFDQHERAVKRLRDHVGERLDFLDDWLECWEAHEGDPEFPGPCPS